MHKSAQILTVCLFLFGEIQNASAQLTESPIVNPVTFGASGSASIATCDIDGTETLTNCADLTDFKVGQHIIVRNAGPAVTVVPPSRAEVSSQCRGSGCSSNGPTEYRYQIASIDANGGISAASAIFRIEHGASDLVAGSRSHYNELHWTPESGAKGYAIYKYTENTYRLIELVTGINFRDYGAPPRDNSGMPTQAPEKPIPGDVLATITVIDSHSVNLSIAKGDPAIGEIHKRTNILHDDTTPLQEAINSIPRTGGTVRIPLGTFNIHAKANGSFSKNIGLYIFQDHFRLLGSGSGTILKLDSGSFSNTALLGSSAIEIDGRAKLSGNGIDDGGYQFGCSRGIEGFEPAASTVNCKLPEYKILRPVPQGTNTLNVDASRSSFAPGNDLFIRTGSISGSAKPDSEINQVAQILAGGLITLRWPATKPYRQECHMQGTTGATSSNCSQGRVISPFAVGNVTAATIHDITLRDFTFYGLDGHSWFAMPAQIVGFEVSGLAVHSGDMFASGGNRFEHIHDNKIFVSYLGAEVIPTDAGGTDFVVERNDITSERPMNIQITEGAANVTWRDNHIKGPPAVAFDQSGNIGQLFSGNGRCYRVSLIGNRLSNTSGNQFMKLGSADQITPGERSCTDGLIEDNVMEGDAGSAYANSGATKVHAGDLYGNGWVVRGNLMNGALANFNIVPAGPPAGSAKSLK